MGDIFKKPGRLAREGLVQSEKFSQIYLIGMRVFDEGQNGRFRGEAAINGKPDKSIQSINANGASNSTTYGTANTVESPDSPAPPDGGWGWVVMVASLVLIFLTDGVAFSVGTIYPSIKNDFNADSAKASLVSSLINAFSLLLGPAASVLADFYGHRAVAIFGSVVSLIAFLAASFSPDIDVAIITYGFLAGTGFAFMYVSSIVVVGLYFDRRRALAVGVSSSGSGVGIFVIAAITGALLKVVSWRTISQIEAALMVLGIISGMTLRPLPKNPSQLNLDKTTSKFQVFIERLDIKLFKILPFNLINCVFVLGTAGCMLPFMYLPDVALQYGIDNKDGAFLLSITGITNTISRVLAGFVIFRFPIISPVLLLGSVSVVGGIFTLCVPLMTNYPALAVYAAVLGFVYAGDAALTPLMLIEILDYTRLNSSVGFMCMIRGATILVTGPIGGYLQDVTLNYDATFYLSGCSLLFSALFCMLTWLAVKRAKKLKSSDELKVENNLGQEDIYQAKNLSSKEGVINYGMTISDEDTSNQSNFRDTGVV